MTRAFTLLEILLATAMLALIAMASTSLVQTASRARAAREAPLRWHAAAERTLDLIASDLRRADLGIVPESVIAREGELRLASRAPLDDGPGPAEIVYRLDPDGRLHRELRPLARQLGARGEPVASSVVLGDVDTFTPQRNEERSALVIHLQRTNRATDRRSGRSVRVVNPPSGAPTAQSSGRWHMLELRRTVKIP